MNDRPWMTALEKQFAAVQMMHLIKDQDSSDPAFAEAKRAFGTWEPMLRGATAYAWSSDTYSAVTLASKTIPSETKPTPYALPSKESWWWFGDTQYVCEFGHGEFPVVAIFGNWCVHKPKTAGSVESLGKADD